MQNEFFELSDFIGGQLQGDERFTAWFAGETTSFCRFNHAKARQAGDVLQRMLTLRLVNGRKHTSVTLSLSGQAAEDQAKVVDALDDLRADLAYVPDDPYLLLNETVSSSERKIAGELPAASAVMGDVLGEMAGLDAVGIFASGTIVRGFANELGQRNWFETANYNLDWSIYAHGDKAVKSGLAGQVWDRKQLAAKIATAKEQLAVVAKPARELKPGKYRAYLTPAALDEIADMLSWGGFSAKAVQTKTSPLMKLNDGSAQFDPRIQMFENTAGGFGPDFDGAGFPKPSRVDLVRDGKKVDLLVSPRTGQEYDLPANGAGEGESPAAFAMTGGDIAQADILKTLDTGLYLNNLWYLNFSDRPAGRITGMSRFACFWVENGEIKDPLNVMRFDESLFHIFGSGLEGLTQEVETALSPMTYGERATAAKQLPGAVINDFSLTL